MVGFLTPIMVEKFSYKNKMVEAKSVSEAIANVQHDHYTTKNQYISIKKSAQNSLSTRLNIRKVDLKYYDYTVTTTLNSYTIVAEPKIKFLRSREIPPKVYTYSHKLGSDKEEGSWSRLN